MRCVMPREESRSTLCLFFLFFDSDGEVSLFSSSISRASSFLFPFLSEILAFADWALSTEAMAQILLVRRNLFAAD